MSKEKEMSTDTLKVITSTNENIIRIRGVYMDFSRVTQEERERLYNEVWTDPVITVAQRYNMSDDP